jgi:16S rRNA G966 N2-methylase RsmD
MIDHLNKPEVQQFIQDHLQDDPAELALQSSKYPDLPIKEIAHQIKCYQNAKVKLPAFAAKKGIIYPPGVSLEQSSSEATARYKAGLVHGNSLTDLTAGFGVDVYYFAQRIEKVIGIEKNPDLIHVVQHNLDELHCANVVYGKGDATKYLQSESTVSDIYYLDPARRDDANQKVHQIEDCRPNLLELLPIIMDIKATAWIKLSPLLDIHQALEKLRHVSEVHVVSVENECKELLFCCKPEFEGESEIIAVNLKKDKEEKISFSYEEEKETCSFAEPKKYLYEPNASIMKAGGFHSVARDYGLAKLHRNSHLYTSEGLVTDFPGRTFEIKATTVLNKKKLKEFLPDGKANITVRNYPNTVKEIRKKTAIKDGGWVYLFATTLMNGNPKVLVCEKLS